MRTAIPLLLLLGGALLAAPEPPRFSVVDDWEIHGDTLVLGCIGWPIRLAEVARRLEMKEDAARAYVTGLDPKLPLLVQQDAQGAVVGLRQVTAELLAKELRIELTAAKSAKAGGPVAFEAKLVNGGKAAHRVVRPNDGSESGWREPEIYFEREVDGEWVRGGKPGRCGMFATEWQKDITELKPGEKLPLEGYLPPEMSFDLSKPGKVKLRAVYVYRGGYMERAPDEKPDPGPMGKTPPFTLVSEPVEVAVGA
jgi:hypothetical protein